MIKTMNMKNPSQEISFKSTTPIQNKKIQTINKNLQKLPKRSTKVMEVKPAVMDPTDRKCYQKFPNRNLLTNHNFHK